MKIPFGGKKMTRGEKHVNKCTCETSNVSKNHVLLSGIKPPKPWHKLHVWESCTSLYHASKRKKLVIWFPLDR
jgi:hypothetical protein